MTKSTRQQGNQEPQGPLSKEGARSPAEPRALAEGGRAEPRESHLSPEELTGPIEALLFASPEPLSLGRIKKVLGRSKEEAPVIKAALKLLRERTAGKSRGILLEEIAGGWQFLSRSEYQPLLDRMGRAQKKERLSAAALETLAVVAYKQPVTRAEVDAIRGVASGPLLRSLIDLKLLKVTGRAPIPGAPFQYGTSRGFLSHFGLRSPKDLPDPKEAARLLGERESGSVDAPSSGPHS